jgi:hypothetical protein
MNYQKKYLKYKQKYFNLKNQHGGDLADDVLRAHNNIKKLNQSSITIPSEIIQNLSRSLFELNTFYISLRIEEREEEMLKRMVPFTIVKILWINFFKNFCDIITRYHHSIMNSHDESTRIRILDIYQKLESIQELLLEWDYYLPPNLEDIEIPESNLTEAMLFSEKYAHNIYREPQTPVEIGFRNPPRFIRKTKIPYNPETMDHIIFKINNETEKNIMLINMSRYNESWRDNGIQDISSKIEEIFNEKRYIDLEDFFEQHGENFIIFGSILLNERDEVSYSEFN